MTKPISIFDDTYRTKIENANITIEKFSPGYEIDPEIPNYRIQYLVSGVNLLNFFFDGLDLSALNSSYYLIIIHS